ncbi:dynein regulatory complex protein 1 [Chanos chanos]|uniref:Dynein regulatory complex protein 1 n=1 Tax=Chanos chanos TaxID=29144 RepID=A0A6J2V4L6_CHACN|nr:dynein regulatory complex protein 1 [Chanos chanos]
MRKAGNSYEAQGAANSDSAAERITARRLRIGTRNEAKKRQELGQECPKVVEEEVRKSQVQVEQSERRMTKLQTNGTELVTNILVATDARESQRRKELEEARRLRLEKLENEGKSSYEKFQEINEKWTIAKTKELPQDLRDAQSSQQQLCAQLIADKNQLINELQQELKAFDERYVKDLKKQAEDVDLMIARMEDQVRTLIKSYRQELDQIENSFEDEQEALLMEKKENWEQQTKQRRDKEMELLLQRIKQVEEYGDLLQKLRAEDAEEFNIIKIKLETEVEDREQRLQQEKAIHQLNQEKLDYNYQMLKNSDEEKTIIMSVQKRKITRMQDALNNLKGKCANQVKQSREENQSLTEDYKRNMQQYKRVEKKMKHFAAVNAKRFEDVWLMNEEEVKALVRKVLEVDRLIHEQQLGLTWVPPPMPFMEQSGPTVTQHPAQTSARQAAAKALQADEQEDKAEQDVVESSGGLERKGAGVDGKTVKQVLELLCDETGFLIEDKLLKLLSPVEKDEQSLMKLDSVFSAIGIENEEDVYKMTDFFMKYKQKLKEQEEVTLTLSGGGSSDLIHPNDVLVALRAFTAQHCRSRKGQSQQQHSGLSLEGRDEAEDAKYWESLANIIPESKLKLWAALEAALNMYHSELMARSKLLEETKNLKQQNTEIKMLLYQHYIPKVHAEVEVPQMVHFAHK